MWRVYFLTFTQPQFLSLLKVLQVLAYNTYTKKKSPFSPSFSVLCMSRLKAMNIAYIEY